jgi:DNA-binding GntR family transcriptional regulator
MLVAPVYPLKRHRTLTEQAADAIRARIISGEFPLGAALSEITIAAELGVSKTPVREAFLQLKNEGLVDIQPQRGTFVFQMTGEQVRQLSAFRGILELEALRLAMIDDPRGLAVALGNVVARMDQAAAADDPARYRLLDNELHHLIIAASGNPFIETAYAGIAFRVQTLRNLRKLQPPHDCRSLDEHRRIADQVTASDREGALAALSEHLHCTLGDYIALVETASRQRSR